MYNKKLFILIAAGLLVSSGAIVLVQVMGIPLKYFIAGIVQSPPIGLLIVSYLLGFVLSVPGVGCLSNVKE